MITDWKKQGLLISIFALLSLGCSAGAFLGQAPIPTPTPTKTPRPIFTATLIPSDTPMPSDTPTETSTDTPTPMPSETATEPPPPTKPPQPTRPPAPPPPPTNTPEPTATPAPTYPFPAVSVTYPTGSQLEFRITGFVWEGNINTGVGQVLHGYQFKVVGPTGQKGLSNISGGGNRSTQGDDAHLMNFEYKLSPYQPGLYKVSLIKDGVQVSPTVEVTAQAEPYTYAHVDFIRPK